MDKVADEGVNSPTEIKFTAVPFAEKLDQGNQNVWNVVVKLMVFALYFPILTMAVVFTDALALISMPKYAE